MSGTEDLENLLSRLKEEVGPLPPEPLQAPVTPWRRDEGEAPRPRLPAVRPERFTRALRGEAQRDLPGPAGSGNTAWSENKEIMLFGALTSLIIILGGILAGIDYLVLIGSVAFMLFAFMLLLYLFGHYLKFRPSGPGNTDLAERVDALSRKIEMLNAKAVSASGSAYSRGGPDRERELEHKVEELRMLVKTLAKSVEQQDR